MMGFESTIRRLKAVGIGPGYATCPLDFVVVKDLLFESIAEGRVCAVHENGVVNRL